MRKIKTPQVPGKIVRDKNGEVRKGEDGKREARPQAENKCNFRIKNNLKIKLVKE